MGRCASTLLGPALRHLCLPWHQWAWAACKTLCTQPWEWPRLEAVLSPPLAALWHTRQKGMGLKTFVL